MTTELIEAVFGRLGVERPAIDLDGLRAVYAAWCGAVPFENTLKLIHVFEELPGPLPGSTTEDFFGSWLEHGTGGTCWAANGALHDLLAALGFDVQRAIATMLPSPDVRGPNHGSVVVTLDGDRWITDASILSGEPIRITDPGESDPSAPLPRLDWLGDKPAIVWRMLRAPSGFPCRIERVGAGPDEFDALHQRTATWSPFNYQLSARLQRNGRAFGAEVGQRFVIEPDGSLDAAPLAEQERASFLIETMGISEAIARRVPPDRPVPPRP